MEGEGGAGFCVKCGAVRDDLIGALCFDCTAGGKRFVHAPESVAVELCPHCGARRVRNHWEPADDPEVLRPQDLNRNVTVDPPARLIRLDWVEGGHNPRVRMMTGKAVIAFGDAQKTEEFPMEARIVHITCPDCSRRGGRFYTAHIQLRAHDAKAKRASREFNPWAHGLWERFLENAPKKPQESMSWEEELKEGWDVYFMDTAAAKSLARGFKDWCGAEVKESASLWGTRDGVELYRVTILVRLPPVVVGDILEVDDQLWEVLKLTRESGAQVENVQRGSLRTLSSDELRTARFVGGPECRGTSARVPTGGAVRWRHPVTEELVALTGLRPGNEADPATPQIAPSEIPVIVDRKRLWWAPRSSAARRPH